LWNERGQNSVNIYMGKTTHLVIVAQQPQAHPPEFLAIDAG
jgi:hypothetical protein